MRPSCGRSASLAASLIVHWTSITGAACEFSHKSQRCVQIRQYWSLLWQPSRKDPLQRHHFHLHASQGHTTQCRPPVLCPHSDLQGYPVAITIRSNPCNRLSLTTAAYFAYWHARLSLFVFQHGYSIPVVSNGCHQRLWKHSIHLRLYLLCHYFQKFRC